jgi:hypothetical protein
MDDISGGGTSFILQHDGTNTLFKHDTTERMRVTSGGEILFGKTAEDNTTQGIRIDAPFGLLSASRDGNLPLLVNRNTSDGDVIDIRKDGTTVGVIGTQNWGIGTSSPDTLLTMQDDSDVDGSLLTFKNQYRVSSTTADIMGGIAFSAWRDVSSSASYCAAIYGKNTGYPGSSGNLVFATRTNGDSDPTDVTERMRIDSSGNVGIGTSSPSTYGLFTVSGSGITNHINSTSGAGGINFYESGSGRFSLRSLNGSAGLAFYDSFNGSERMRIDSSGRLTVGNSSALSLGVIGSKFNGSTENGIVVETTRDATGSTFIRFNDSDSAAIGSIYQNGASTVLYATSSDYRLKENVVYDFDALSRLNQLKPARFNFIADADTTVDGFLAHEVQDIVPEAIMGTHNEVEVWKEGEELPEGVSVGDNKTDEDGNTIPVHQGIDQSKLVPLLVKAVQELSAKVEALEAQLQGN